MSWRDRPYAADDDDRSGLPQMRLQFPRPGTAVMWLLIVNVAAHFVNVAASNWVDLSRVFGLSLAGLKHLLVWQPVTYMFMHSTGGGQVVWHLLFNMLMLYFIGVEVERLLGTRRFLQFYFTCGLVGGLAYVVFSLLRPAYAGVPIVGASGAVYGLLLAAMIFFPQMKILVFVFLMPIRVFGLLLIAFLVLQGISPGGVGNPGGEVCHIAGAAAGLALFRLWGMLPKVRIPAVEGVAGRLRRGAWERRQRARAAREAEVDRILEKVHREGIAGLTGREKRVLAEATRRQQAEDRRAGRGPR